MGSKIKIPPDVEKHFSELDAKETAGVSQEAKDAWKRKTGEEWQPGVLWREDDPWMFVGSYAWARGYDVGKSDASSTEAPASGEEIARRAEGKPSPSQEDLEKHGDWSMASIVNGEASEAAQGD